MFVSGIKNNAASLAFLQEKPQYINRDEYVCPTCVCVLANYLE